MPLAPDPLDTPPSDASIPPPLRAPVGPSGDQSGSHPSTIGPQPTPEDQAVETERRELESGEESAT